MRRNHTRAPGHPPPLDHRTHHHLGTTDRPPPPPPHRPRGCHHHTNGGRPHNSSPHPRRPHTRASIIGTYDGTFGPHPMASHRHHLPHPQRPHTHLAAKVGGHLGGPPPRTPRAHGQPPHPPPGTRSRPSTTRHTHPGVMGVRHTNKPTSGGGHQDRNIHPARRDPDAAPQHPTRLHHLLGISRPRHPHPPTRALPPRHQHNRPPPGRSSGSHPGRCRGNLEPQYLVETEVAPHAKAQEKPQLPKLLHPPLKLDTKEHTPHNEWAAHYIIVHTTTRKNDAASITVTRHFPHSTQVYELTPSNVLVTHRRHDE